MACKVLLHVSPCIHSVLISNHSPDYLPHFSHAGLPTPSLAGPACSTPELCMGCSLCPEQLPPDVYTANSLTSFRSLLSCDLLSEAFPGHPI